MQTWQGIFYVLAIAALLVAAGYRRSPALLGAALALSAHALPTITAIGS